jgi:hypothetical protein
MLSDEAMRARMAPGWRGGLHDGTVCGFGSTLEATAVIRAWLPDVARRHQIRSVCDAGAGDLHWIRSVRWDVAYLAFDLIPRHPSVERRDITVEVLPTSDAVLCRHVLNHLDDARIRRALALFARSARYLIATQFDQFDGSKEFTRLDLRPALGEPIEAAQDGGAENCLLALWKL